MIREMALPRGRAATRRERDAPRWNPVPMEPLQTPPQRQVWPAPELPSDKQAVLRETRSPVLRAKQLVRHGSVRGQYPVTEGV
jgi:hypothetical protein